MLGAMARWFWNLVSTIVSFPLQKKASFRTRLLEWLLQCFSMVYAIWNQVARTRLSTLFHKKKLKKFCSVTTSEQRCSNSRTSLLYLAPDDRPGNECRNRNVSACQKTRQITSSR